MANIKKSAEVKKLQGTHRADRANKNAPIPAGALGNAPVFMSDEEQSAWDEIAQSIPEGVASAADRLAFEILVRLLCKVRSGDATGTETTLLMRSFANFGMTPLHRNSVSAVPEKKGPSKWCQ